MADIRYKKSRVFTNDSEYYKPLRETRDLIQVRQYETPILKNPTFRERTSLVTNTHIWKYGDRLYKLANQYYGDSRFWWVIAWYNGMPCEAEIPLNTVLYIPINLDGALKALGVA